MAKSTRKNPSPVQCKHGKTLSSAFDAAVNLAKYCIGAGILALPYATARGGLVFSPVMIAVTAAWNGLAAQMMMQCRDECQRNGLHFPPHLSNTYSKIAYAGAGRFGDLLTEFSIIVTLLGVCIAYQITFATLLRDVVLLVDWTALWSPEKVQVALTVVSGLIAYPVSCARNLDALSSISVAGLGCLIMGIAAILVHGALEYGATAFKFSDSGEVASVLPLFPVSIDDMTSFFGIAVFCFDICSLAFPIEESMRDRSQFPLVVWSSLFFVWLMYTLLGEFGALLYVHDDLHHGVKDNVLSNLPGQSSTAVLVRCAMAAVSLLTYPLTLTPAAQMVEHWLKISPSSNDFSVSSRGDYNDPESAVVLFASRDCDSVVGVVEIDSGEVQMRDYSSFRSSAHTSESAESGSNWNNPKPESWYELLMRSGNRFLLASGTTLFAAYVPCFGEVISFLGAFTISILCFVLPPLLHLRIVTMPQLSSDYYGMSSRRLVAVGCDAALLIVGVGLSAFATTVTSAAIIHRLQSGKNC